ncbi:MAG: DUF4332 domain-containing protein, partial [Candidatus Sericytochromatia bacterium]|nr:DUF4332 domain-containing protein [Candidatus Tanganyikabacteria bacterium]
MKYLSLLAAALMAGCAAVPATSPALQNKTAAAVEAEGTYKLEDILGIGPKYAESLRGAGVTTIAKLLAAAETREERKQLARETGIPYGNVLHIARKVQLMEIHGVGVRQGNLLEAVGVDGIKELAQRVPANLHERLVFANQISRPFVKRNPSLSM